jgi:hypothetical protein
VDAARRRQTIQLAVLGVLLAGVVYFVLWPAIFPTVIAPGPVTVTGGAPGKKASGKPVEVRLGSLDKTAAELKEEGARRNPFRMGAATAPVPEGTSAARVPPKPVTPVVQLPVGPPPPPPLPPIPYRFIGVLSGAPGQGKIAVLTDGRTVVHGRVNAEIEGRYRIVQIGEESVQMEYLDGRGRQTIRLLGQ